MELLGATTTCFKKYATFSGRSSRSEYWYFVLFGFLVGFTASIIEGITSKNVSSILLTTYQLIVLLPSIAVTVRRLHDTNRSGWWILIAFTIIGIIPLIIWYATKGTIGENRFGKDPLQDGAES